MRMSGVISTDNLIAVGSESVTSSSESIPFGYCHCGCGGKTPISKQTYKKKKLIKGQPCWFIRSHGRRIRPLIEVAKPFKIDGVYCRLIPLTQGQWAIIDASDYDWLMQWKWCALWNKYTRSYYAIRADWFDRKNHIVKMHRAILGLDYGERTLADHKNGITLDNRRANLRRASYSQNVMNGKIRSNNASGFTGVYLRGLRYQVYITVNYKKIFVGSSRSFEEARQMRIVAEREYHKDFAGRSSW